jgi:hypothetical protein
MAAVSSSLKFFKDVYIFSYNSLNNETKFLRVSKETTSFSTVDGAFELT